MTKRIYMHPTTECLRMQGRSPYMLGDASNNAGLQFNNNPVDAGSGR